MSGACSESVLVAELLLPAELCRDSMLGSHCELLEIKVSVVVSLTFVLRELSKLEHRGRNSWWPVLVVLHDRTLLRQAPCRLKLAAAGQMAEEAFADMQVLEALEGGRTVRQSTPAPGKHSVGMGWQGDCWCC